jgi:hypothetical protein
MSHNKNETAQERKITLVLLLKGLTTVTNMLPARAPMPIEEDTIPSAIWLLPVLARTIAGIMLFPAIDANKFINEKKSIIFHMGVCSLKKFNPEKQFFKNDSFILLLSAEITGILIKNNNTVNAIANVIKSISKIILIPPKARTAVASRGYNRNQ